jgi:hypothetical protein
MRARSLALPAGSGGRRAPAASLLFLRGREADDRLRELAAARSAARPVLGALAGELLRRKLFELLGYRSLGDYAREHLGVGPRTVREWARVWNALQGLPLLRFAVRSGEVSWSVARRVVGLVTPETEKACLETVSGRTLRAVEAIVAAVREQQSLEMPSDTVGEEEEQSETQERVLVRLRCSSREALLWHAAVELARRMAGEQMPLWRCAEAIAAEFGSAAGCPESNRPENCSEDGPAAETADPRDADGSAAAAVTAARCEHGLRDRAFPELCRGAPRGRLPTPLAGLAAGLAEASPREVDRRLGAAIAFLQGVDLEAGRILRELADRRLYRELGFESVERYAAERIDVSGRTARRLIALARAGQRVPALARAFGEGSITAFQAHAVARVADRASAAAWVERARAVTLRRLEDDVAARIETAGRPAVIAFRAPPRVAALLRGAVQRVGSLEALLAHAIVTWVRAGAEFTDYADFERDGFRCTVPGCTARRSLHSHHLRFRSARGPDLPWNRTTLCAFHHLRGVHLGTLRIRGRAPDALVFELGCAPRERFRSGDLRWPQASRVGSEPM